MQAKVVLPKNMCSKPVSVRSCSFLKKNGECTCISCSYNIATKDLSIDAKRLCEEMLEKARR